MRGADFGRRWLAATTLVAAGCGAPAAASRDARTLVADVERAEPTALERVVARFATDTCAVEAESDDASTIARGDAAEVERLVGLAAALCDAGVHQAPLAWDARGTPRLRSATPGAFVQANIVAVDDTFEPLALDRTSPDGTVSRCGVRFAEEPDLRLYATGDAQPVLQVAADAAVVVRLIDSDGNDRCLSEDELVELRTHPVEGLARVWVAADAPSPYELRVTSAPTAAFGTRSWTPGTTWSMDVRVGPYFRSPDEGYSAGAYCSGSIGEAPTVRVFIPQEGYGAIYSRSESDPVLAVYGPDGQVMCNDDYDSLDPRVEGWFAPGEWEVYLGSYGAGDVFDATLTFD